MNAGYVKSVFIKSFTFRRVSIYLY